MNKSGMFLTQMEGCDKMKMINTLIRGDVVSELVGRKQNGQNAQTERDELIIGNAVSENVGAAQQSEESSIEVKQKFTETEAGVFRFEGVFTLEDVEKINSMKNKTTLVLENTKGLSSELLGKIESDRVFFSVKGGLDHEKKSKFDTENYRQRTMLSPKGLEKVVGYFEHVEEDISPEWTDLQKAMYAYNCLAVDTDYVYEGKGEHCDMDFDDEMGRGTIERSLNGMLYGKLICAGYALTFQEMMDRIGVESYYCNQRGVHAYNVIKCDGKYHGIDVTWDSVNKEMLEGRCGFAQFGADEEFYSRNGHKNYAEEIDFDWESDSLTRKVYDDEEERFPLSVLSEDEVKRNLTVILPVIDSRKNGSYQNFANQSRETKAKYLPIDTIKMNLINEANREYDDFVVGMDCLRRMGALDIDGDLFSALKGRTAYIADITPMTYGGKSSFGQNEIEQCERIRSSERRGEAVDEEAKKQLTDKLNTQLTEQLNKYLDELLQSIDAVIDTYEYGSDEMDNNRRWVQINQRNKMDTILGAKDYLIANGHDEGSINDICEKINGKLAETRPAHHESSEEELREKGLDFLTDAFSDLEGVKEAIEKFEGVKLSDDEFRDKLTDVDYLLGSVFTGLDLNEYHMTKEDFADMIRGLSS